VAIALAEFRRVLKPEGRLPLAVHRGEGELHRDSWNDQPVNIAITLFQLDELISLVTAVGFTVDEAVARPPYDSEHQTVHDVSSRGQSSPPDLRRVVVVVGAAVVGAGAAVVGAAGATVFVPSTTGAGCGTVRARGSGTRTDTGGLGDVVGTGTTVMRAGGVTCAPGDSAFEGRSPRTGGGGRRLSARASMAPTTSRECGPGRFRV
jgi:hypothetical protein